MVEFVLLVAPFTEVRANLTSREVLDCLALTICHYDLVITPLFHHLHLLSRRYDLLHERGHVHAGAAERHAAGIVADAGRVPF